MQANALAIDGFKMNLGDAYLVRDYFGGANAMNVADNRSSIAGVGRSILLANIFFILQKLKYQFGLLDGSPDNLNRGISALNRQPRALFF